MIPKYQMLLLRELRFKFDAGIPLLFYRIEKGGQWGMVCLIEYDLSQPYEIKQIY